MDEKPSHLTHAEEEEARQRTPPAARVVHAAVSKEAEDELERPNFSLLWSGVAAGFLIIASVIAEAAIARGLPDAPWHDAVAALGYPLGFLIVILGRMQLFTENTMVTVLPLARTPNLENLTRVLRLWSLVFLGNMIGAAAVAALVVFGHVQSGEMLTGMLDVSSHLLEKTAGETLLQAIPAGFLIASVAWIRTASDDNGFWIVFVLTYAIAAGGFTHVIAGAAEAFLLLWAGKAGIVWLIATFLAPALIGNIIGGTGLFAVLAHAQVKEEL